MTNPKKHDALFKWLIASFTEEFFEHYFPDIKIGMYKFIDKEFISKYEALKESLKDDLFLIMELEIEGKKHEVVIQIEHMSKRKDVAKRMYRYLCYAWLLKELPVWSIVIYTDNAVWRKPVLDKFWYSFSNKMQKQFCHFDVIKIKSEKSADLIKKHSLLCKLIALKADDSGINREKLIYEIYKAASDIGDKLSDDKKLLIEQWISAYKEIPMDTVEKIKKEIKMSFTATTISEHIQNEGKIEGKKEGRIEGKIKTLQELLKQGLLAKDFVEKQIYECNKKLQKLALKNNTVARLT